MWKGRGRCRKGWSRARREVLSIRNVLPEKAGTFPDYAVQWAVLQEYFRGGGRGPCGGGGCPRAALPRAECVAGKWHDMKQTAYVLRQRRNARFRGFLTRGLPWEAALLSSPAPLQVEPLSTLHFWVTQALPSCHGRGGCQIHMRQIDGQPLPQPSSSPRRCPDVKQLAKQRNCGTMKLLALELFNCSPQLTRQSALSGKFPQVGRASLMNSAYTMPCT